MNFQSVIVALGVFASIIYVARRLRQEWQLKKNACSKCPVTNYGTPFVP